MAATIPLSTNFVDAGILLRNNGRMALGVIIGILAAGIIVLMAVAFALIKRDRANSGPDEKNKIRDRATILKKANKRLAQNPKDARALSEIGDLYYREQDWEKAFATYNALLELAPSAEGIDEFDVTLRHALSALRTDKLDEAYKGLAYARQHRPDLFEVNHNLGYLEYRKKNYEKAAALLREANEQQPEHGPTLRYYGQTLFRLKQYRNAITMLQRAVSQEPGDKESQYVLAQCYYELGQNEQALKIFSHLRADPVYGPSASLRSGIIRAQQKKYDQATKDFEIGLKHAKIKQEVKLELKYRLANAYIRNQEVSKAAEELRGIHAINPNYKDVAQQLGAAEELSTNHNLQVYLLGASSDFVSLCRRIVSGYFTKAQIKLVDIHVESDMHADLLTEVETQSWEDTILFRFMRTTGTVGELMLRDFHTRIKEVKAGHGICFCAGEFSEGAQAFVEARLIDLHGKKDLEKRLQKLPGNF
ncbi:MAG: tetratricopeptide repeat protein [Spirochaetales bacterium]